MLTRRKFLAMLAALPAVAYLKPQAAEAYWWLPKRQREWIAGAGQCPHVFYGESRMDIADQLCIASAGDHGCQLLALVMHCARWARSTYGATAP